MSAGLAQRLAQRLSAQAFCSGEVLAQEFNVTRASIWKAVETLRELGLEIESVKTKGYRLSYEVEWLDARIIQMSLDPRVTLTLMFETSSTNDAVKLIQSHCPYVVVVTETQTQGRGRLGRTWVSPPGGLYFSLKFQSARGVTALNGLSLVVGVAVAKALRVAGVDAWVKWPNDIFIDGAKVGGVLIEATGQNQGQCEVIVGVGINWHLPDSLAKQITQINTSLKNNTSISRNALLVQMINELVKHLNAFETQGFSCVQNDWRAYDYLHGKTIDIQRGTIETGRVMDVNDAGALIVEHHGVHHALVNGEISVRTR